MRRALVVASLLLVPALGVAHSQGYATDANRPADLSLDPGHRHAEAQGGETVKLDYTLENTGRLPQDVDLSVRGYPSHWPSKVEPSQVQLDPGETADVTLHVRVPDDSGKNRPSPQHSTVDRSDGDRAFFRIRAEGQGAGAAANATVHRTDDGSGGAPNLVVGNLTWSPEHPEPGDEVVFSATVANLGDAPVDEAEVGFAVDRQKLGIAEAGTLEPGESTRVHSDAWTAEEGRHRVYAAADPHDEVHETREKDNYAYEDFHVREGPRDDPGTVTVTT